MRGTIAKLFVVSTTFVLFALASLYAGSRSAAAHPPPTPAANPLGAAFAADPGDGWVLLGCFLFVIALAIASAGAMLWRQEKRSAL